MSVLAREPRALAFGAALSFGASMTAILWGAVSLLLGAMALGLLATRRGD